MQTWHGRNRSCHCLARSVPLARWHARSIIPTVFAWLNQFFRSTDSLEATLGRRGEKAAAKFLQKHGFKIVCRNYRCTLGEIDIVAREGPTLVFVEVKTRAYDEPAPEVQVNRTKQHQLTKAARQFLARFGDSPPPARFDVIAVIWAEGDDPKIRHIPNAFEPTF